MEEYVKEIDELKQLYIKVCSEKEHSLNEKEKLEKHFSELSAQFESLDKQYGIVVKGGYINNINNIILILTITLLSI